MVCYHTLYYFKKLIMQTLSYLQECPPACVPILPVLVDVPLKPLELGLNVITCEVSEFIPNRMFCCLFTLDALLQCLRIVRTRTTTAINITSNARNATEMETRTAITSISMISVLVPLSAHVNEFNKSLPINSPEHVVY